MSFALEIEQRSWGSGLATPGEELTCTLHRSTSSVKARTIHKAPPVQLLLASSQATRYR